MIKKNIVLATNNLNKIEEFNNIFKKYKLKIIPQKKFGIFNTPEIGLSFVENAIIKARNAIKISGLDAISDDSGLSVNILKGQPGIYSSRFSKKKPADKKNIKKLLHIMRNIPDHKRQAQLECVLVYQSYKKKEPIIAYGNLKGFLTYEPIGNNGFGYDSIFYIPKLKLTVGQLNKKEKNKISHRLQAVNMLMNILKRYSIL